MGVGYSEALRTGIPKLYGMYSETLRYHSEALRDTTNAEAQRNTLALDKYSEIVYTYTIRVILRKEDC